MTSPDQQVPTGGYTATTVYQLQNVDPDEIGRAQNVDMRDQLEAVRGNLFDQLLGGFLNVPAALAPIINGVFNGWFGGGSVGDPLEVQYTIEAIKDAVINGYTVLTVTSSGTRTIPESIVEAYAIVVGGGETGQNGRGITGYSNGGRGGGYASAPLDAQAVAGQTLTCTVGASGSETKVTLGAAVLASIQAGGTGGIASGVFGYTPTTSAPGSGGQGGYGRTVGDAGVPATPGLPGTASAIAKGGAGGAVISVQDDGRPGSAGENADPAANVKSAGGGGGGGAGGGVSGFVNEFALAGGAGGPGGYPGGGGGGGGGGGRNGVNGTIGTNGAGGIGATGIIWLIYR